MRTLFLICLSVLFSKFSFSQDFISQDLIVSDYVEGTFLIPNKKLDKKTVVIIIPGSGPTDRDGNQNFQNNNSLKYLAEDIANEGIATFRYDKRVLTLLKKGKFDIKKVSFENFIEDAKTVVNYFKIRRRYDNVFIIGHSQGSLVGMLACEKNVTGFISLAGPGETIDKTILEQLKSMNSPEIIESAKKTFEIIKEGKIDKNFNASLFSFFNPDTQPFIGSWMKYDPVKEIKKLKIPTYIINGTTDIQVTENDAKLLKEAKPDAEYDIIKDMNHVLKFFDNDDAQENYKTHNLPQIKNHKDIAPKITAFIKANSK